MKKTELHEKSLKALKAMAVRLGLKRLAAANKNDLITEILAAEKIKKIQRKSSGKSSPAKISSSKEMIAGKPAKAAVSRRSPPKRVAAPPAPPPPAAVEHKFETPGHPLPSTGSSPYDNLGELPESYGTGRLFFAARDPHWIYSYWDYTRQQMEEMRRRARHGELKLRVYMGLNPQAPLQQEITLNPVSRNWFIHVGQANTDYCAEFGYYDHHGVFIVTSRSRSTRTPPDRMSDRTDTRFVTIPFRFSFRELFEMVKAYFKEGEELADVLHRLQLAGFRFPFDYPGAPFEAPEVDMDRDLFRRIRMGSETITEWFHRRLVEESSSGWFAPSSPFGASFGAPHARGFWFKVNAELVVYGATDPKARVVLDDKEVVLKPDGTFRLQFALPDGSYKVPMKAISPDGVETREANLEFTRKTSGQDDVGVIPHSMGMTPPSRS